MMILCELISVNRRRGHFTRGGPSYDLARFHEWLVVVGRLCQTPSLLGRRLTETAYNHPTNLGSGYFIFIEHSCNYNYFALASAFFSAVALASASLYDARSIA
jgi:hypothetical protein